MSRRSRKHRKRFNCGHRGFGQYCHRCADRQNSLRLQREALQKHRVQQREWQTAFKNDAVNLRKLPKEIVLRARDLLDALEQGADYWQVAGKRLCSARRIIRIPVTRRYRLLCRDDGSQLTPLKVVSHEDYNQLVSSMHRWLKHWLKER